MNVIYELDATHSHNTRYAIVIPAVRLVKLGKALNDRMTLCIRWLGVGSNSCLELDLPEKDGRRHYDNLMLAINQWYAEQQKRYLSREEPECMDTK